MSVSRGKNRENRLYYIYESELKVGDLVRVKDAKWYQDHCDETGRIQCHGNSFVKCMEVYLGKTGKIVEIVGEFDPMDKITYQYKVLFPGEEVDSIGMPKDNHWSFTSDMFDNVILDIAR